MIHRRNFVAALGATPFLLQAASPQSFRFAVIADSHIIDDFYKGPEGNAEDTDSIFKTSERLIATRDHINSLTPKVDRVFLVGDYFHNYPSPDIDFYFQNKTRIDLAKDITDKFEMPVHAGFGNHDYDVPHFSRENSHELFRRKFNLKPYYSLEHKGFKFVHLNNFLGATWTPGHKSYNRAIGSLGEEQLNWFEAELREHKPTFVFIHFPLMAVDANERAGYSTQALLKRYKDTVQIVISGHWHKWFEFGRTFGPPHLVIGATRYDPHAYLIVEADPDKATHRFLNIDGVDWNTHYSKEWA